MLKYIKMTDQTGITDENGSDDDENRKQVWVAFKSRFK